MYYTKDGLPTLYPQTEPDRFKQWVQKVSDWAVITKVEYRNGRPFRVERVIGTGIDVPTEEELEAVYATPCRYRRAALAGRA